MDDGKRVVWILGAGFSQPLGGPLLDDLVSPERLTRVRERVAYECERTNDPTPSARLTDWSKVIELYKMARGVKRPNGLVANPGPYGPVANAEEFLEIIETAEALDGAEITRRHAQARIRQWISEEGVLASLQNKSILTLTRSYVAAACSEFVETSEQELEKWLPYKRWGKSLTKNDTVISFNYDRVVELAVGGKLHTFIPDDFALPDNAPCLLKLHGSVDWLVDGDRVQKSTNAWIDIATKEPLIVAPGPAKASVRNGKFKPLWDQAIARLAAADVIVIVGYQFAAGDAYARTTLLNAIDRQQTRRLTACIVLGAERTPEVERVLGMLMWALPKTKNGKGIHVADRGDTILDGVCASAIVLEPMRSQDFLSVFTHERLSVFS